jgi:sugar phosphate isomerase/epimerase
MKFAICNEIFEGWSWPDIVHAIAKAGYDGVEVAPFTLAESVTDLSANERATLRQQAEGAGIAVAGLHWLFVSPKGLHATTNDAATRQRTTAYLKELIHFCGDLGGEVMIVGSPKQRDVQPGVSYETAWGRFVDMIEACVDLAAERQVILCIPTFRPCGMCTIPSTRTSPCPVWCAATCATSSTCTSRRWTAAIPARAILT